MWPGWVASSSAKGPMSLYGFGGHLFLVARGKGAAESTEEHLGLNPSFEDLLRQSTKSHRETILRLQNACLRLCCLRRR